MFRLCLNSVFKKHIIGRESYYYLSAQQDVINFLSSCNFFYSNSINRHLLGSAIQCLKALIAFSGLLILPLEKKQNDEKISSVFLFYVRFFISQRPLLRWWHGKIFNKYFDQNNFRKSFTDRFWSTFSNYFTFLKDLHKQYQVFITKFINDF